MPLPCQSFLPMPALRQQQFSQNTPCAKPRKPLARKRLHVCPVRSCGKCFTTSGNLSRHKRLHGKIDPLSCPIDGCICAFPSTNKLERHLKFHYGGDVKVCHVEACGRTFSTTGNLNRHIKKHHGGVGSPSAVSSVTTTPTQEDDVKSSAKSWTMCSTSGESDADSDASTEQWWSSPSTPGTSAATFDCVWSDDLLATLASILDDGAEPVKQQQPQQC
ncbi:Zinc finger protein [Phytophthora cinnamomi]|uniref:Zinc finger protein n=1 Tax=Phytophthora cinnamomi TaxID=4785 RepID=UPI00355A74DD|nr:Zinc finger protein [Phytophthora cinnamomi]